MLLIGMAAWDADRVNNNGDNYSVGMGRTKITMSFSTSLGPFHGAIAVPSVTHCRCRRCRGHQCAGGARQYR